MESDLVSIIIPVYNGEDYIQESVQSAINQSYSNIEIIVVNDGSTDQTIEKLKPFNSNIKVISKENGGVASALNSGICEANGDYIAWLSHDDIFYSSKISKQIRFLIDHPSFIACYTDFQIIDPEGNPVKNIITPWYPAKEIPYQFLKNMYINGSTTMITKRILLDAGLFNPNLLHTQDLDMWLRLSKFGEIGKVEEILLKSRSHPLQGSLNFEKQISEEQNYFNQLVAENSITYFFPFIKNSIEDAPSKINAQKHFLIGKVFLKYRKWPNFALNHFQIASKNLNKISHKLFTTYCKIIIFLFGDESDTITYKKRAVMALGFGENDKARRFSINLFLRHPLRLDILVIYLKSLIPIKTYRSIRKLIKNR